MDILDVIKGQINNQIRPHTNVHLHNTNVKALGAKDARDEFTIQKEIIPQWVIGRYTLQRASSNVPWDELTPSAFMEYSGNIEWGTEDGVSVLERDVAQYTNYMSGVQVYSDRSTSVTIALYNMAGSFSVFTQQRGQTAYTLLGTFDGVSKIDVPIGAHVWTSIFILFYASSSAEFTYGADFSNIKSWRRLLVGAPSAPTWADDVSFEIVRQDVALGRNVLKWNKDTTVSFSGNGVYRQSLLDSGIDTVSPLPTPLLRNQLTTSDFDKWITAPINATINSGDKLSYSLLGAKHTVGDVKRISPNLLSNSYFANDTLNWTVNAPVATVQDAVKKVGNTYLRISGELAAQQISITSATIAVSGSLYFASINTSNNLLDTVPYNAEGWKVNPSRWASSNLLSFASGTFGEYNVLTVTRGSVAGSIRSQNAVRTCYLSTAATYYLTCPASFVFTSPFRFEAVSLGGAVLTSATLYGSRNFEVVTHAFKPSTSADAYIRLTVPGRTAQYPFATFHFGQMELAQEYNNTASFSERLNMYFYQADNSACAATPLYTELFLSGSDTEHSMQVHPNAPDFQLPNDCAQIKLGYVASIQGGSPYLDRRIYHMVLATSNNKLPFAVYATSYAMVRLNTAGTTAAGESLFLEGMQHLLDRPRQNTDGSSVVYYDTDINENTSYRYYLDAYDSNSLGKRSAFSTFKDVTTGDTVAPKTPSGYTAVAVNGGISHNWTNPTALDLKSIRGFTGGGIILWETLASATSQASAYSEVYTTVEEVTRKLAAVDVSGNISAFTAIATCTPKPQDNTIAFGMAFLDSGFSSIEPVHNGVWYNEPVTASFVVDTSYAIASHLWRLHSEETDDLYDDGWGPWNNVGVGHITFPLELKAQYQFKVKDVYGNSSNIVTKNLYIDTTAPRVNDHDNVWVSCEGKVGYNQLQWSLDSVDDKTTAAGVVTLYNKSGLAETHITRAKIVPLVDNGDFSMGNGATLRKWGYYHAERITASLSANSYFSGNTAARVMFNTTDPTYAGLRHPATINLANGDTVFVSCKVLPSIVNTATVYIEIANEAFAVALKAPEVRISTIATWQTIQATWLNSSGVATIVQVGVGLLDTTLGTINTNGVYFDDFRAYTTPAFATIGVVPSLQNSYIDENVSPWEHYLYKLTFVDNVKWSTTASVSAWAVPKVDARDVYRNMLDNSSFERVRYTSSGTILPENWERTTYDGATFGKDAILTNGDVLVVGGDAYHGQQCLRIGSRLDSSALNGVAINGITSLPMSNSEPRNYVISAYSRRSPDSGTAAINTQILIYGLSNNNVIKAQKTISLADSIEWARTVGTFVATNASISHMSFVIANTYWVNSGTIEIDAVQFEEKDIPVPSDYRDNKSITADYIQGNLIRGHMIEAESLLAGNIKANEITATQIKADTITTNELNLAGADIYLKPPFEYRMNMSPFSSSGSASILGYCSFAVGTKSSGAYSYPVLYYTGCAGTANLGYPRTNDIRWATGNVYVTSPINSRTGVIHNYGTSTLFSGVVSGTVSFVHSNLARRQPYSDPQYSMIIYTVGTTHPGGGGSDVRPNNHHPEILYGVWATQRSLATIDGIGGEKVIGTMIRGVNKEVVYNSAKDKFYAVGIKDQSQGNTDGAIRLMELSKTATLDNAWEYRAEEGFSSTPTGIGFACGSDGTMMVSYTYFTHSQSSNFQYVHLNWYGSDGAIVTPTWSFKTYGGFSKDILAEVPQPSEVFDTACVFATGSKFVVFYSLQSTSDIYYKVVDMAAPTIIVGRDRDLKFSNRYVIPNLLTDYHMEKMRAIKLYGDDLMWYTQNRPALDSFGSDVVGKAIIFSYTKPTVQLEDLFNRVT